MITNRKTIMLLLEACPSFREWFDDMSEFYTDKLWLESGRGPLSLFLTNLSWHLLSLYQEGKTERFPLLSVALERLLTKGNAQFKANAVKDLLESIDCIWSFNKVDPREFVGFLGPKAVRYWNKIHRDTHKFT